jgi:hypothetical protein
MLPSRPVRKDDPIRNCVHRDQPKALLNGGNHAARKLKRAQILLAAYVRSADHCADSRGGSAAGDDDGKRRGVSGT